jgi:hypothetical protein
VGAIALIAGADAWVAARLAFGMLGLQFAIGAVNDLADAPRDRLSRPHKPLPAGLVEPRQATAVAVMTVGLGLWSAGSVGPAPLAVGIVGLADGLAYDLRLKGTVLSWLPFAAGVALLPVYAWMGAIGGLHAAFWGILPMALLAGACWPWRTPWRTSSATEAQERPPSQPSSAGIVSSGPTRRASRSCSSPLSPRRQLSTWSPRPWRPSWQGSCWAWSG